jgi:glutamine amidotransferase
VCRVLAYLGEPLPLRDPLYETDNSLVRQSYSPRMMNTFLNLAGFGLLGWDERSVEPETPFAYRVTTLPAFDPNLRHLAAKIAPSCMIAHVRGVTYSGREVVADTNLHPFRFRGAQVALAHNGHLREFGRMRYDLLEHIRPEVARSIAGTTDSEWIYALVISQLDDPFGLPGADELADAVAAALRILRAARARAEIDTSSPVNLFLTTGRALVTTRFSFDYGWYPTEDSLLETDLPYVSLWYTVGGVYEKGETGWAMTPSEPPRSVLIASEPLTVDTSSWLEVPEYSMFAATVTDEGIDLETRDLDV